VSADSKRLYYMRAVFAVSYTLVSIAHITKLQWDLFLFITNWNMLLTTVTFILMFLAAFKQNGVRKEARDPTCQTTSDTLSAEE
jgi:hypothetical protein